MSYCQESMHSDKIFCEFLVQIVFFCLLLLKIIK